MRYPVTCHFLSIASCEARSYLHFASPQSLGDFCRMWNVSSFNKPLASANQKWSTSNMTQKGGSFASSKSNKWPQTPPSGIQFEVESRDFLSQVDIKNPAESR